MESSHPRELENPDPNRSKRRAAFRSLVIGLGFGLIAPEIFIRLEADPKIVDPDDQTLPFWLLLGAIFLLHALIQAMRLALPKTFDLKKPAGLLILWICGFGLFVVGLVMVVSAAGSTQSYQTRSTPLAPEGSGSNSALLDLLWDILIFGSSTSLILGTLTCALSTLGILFFGLRFLASKVRSTRGGRVTSDDELRAA